MFLYTCKAYEVDFDPYEHDPIKDQSLSWNLGLYLMHTVSQNLNK